MKTLAGTKLTVIIRNDGPLIFAGDTPSYRRVTIELTGKQQELLGLKKVGQNGGVDIYEDVSKVFFED